MDLPSYTILGEFARREHPLASGLSRDENIFQIKNLQNRLQISSLNLEPESLNLLEEALVNYRKNIEEKHEKLSDEETVRLLREVAAYVGEVLIHNTNGEWVSAKNLFGNRISFVGQFRGRKEGQNRSFNRVSFILGDVAAMSWDLILQGKKAEIYKRYYLSIKKEKRFDETLKLP